MGFWVFGFLWGFSFPFLWWWFGDFFEMYINRAYLLFPDGDRKAQVPVES